MARLGDSEGKDHFSDGSTLGKNQSDAKQSLSAQGDLACHFGVADVGEGRLMGKGELQSLFRTWKGQLISLKTEVDWALLIVLDGLEKLGFHMPAQLCWV